MVHQTLERSSLFLAAPQQKHLDEQTQRERLIQTGIWQGKNTHRFDQSAVPVVHRRTKDFELIAMMVLRNLRGRCAGQPSMPMHARSVANNLVLGSALNHGSGEWNITET